MSEIITGGCRCGAVRYECQAEPVLGVTCYCADCQKFYGGERSLALVLPRETLKVTGEVKYFRVTGGSGKPVDRSFCPTCGTQVIGKPDLAPTLVSVTVGSLDDASRFEAQMCVYTVSAQPWAHFPEGVPRFDRLPDQIPEV